MAGGVDVRERSVSRAGVRSVEPGPPASGRASTVDAHMSAPIPDDLNWVVVIPAKPLATAKSRLADVAGTRRPELALAMLVDTVTAAAATPGVRSVLVVTDDERIAAAVSAVGAAVTPDEPRAGLNAAFEHGIAAALSAHPGCGVALLAGDLPALRAAELRGVLHRAWTSPPAAGVIAVADRDGDGTTLLAARTPTQLHPAYGPGSFARHLTLGALDATVADSAGLTGLRCDVDDAAGLRAAVETGVGPATAALLAAAHAEGPESLTDPGP
jgi:2-phospho-L-lactate guanylyltransferase